MVFTTAQIVGWVGDFFWPFMRIAMMLMVAPVFGGRLVPKRLRLIIALVLTAVVVPVIPQTPAVDPLSGAGLLISVQQLLIGLVMGFMLQLVFATLVVGGHLIAMGMGLGFSSMVDPQNGISVPVIGHYFITIATLLFLVLNGHLALIQVVADSFHSLPVGGEGLQRNDLWEVVAWAGRMFAGGVLIAMPVVTALLLTNIAFGVITRAAPQLNIFGVGFPITLTLGFVLLNFALPGLLPQFTGLLEDALGLLGSLGSAAGG
ncbi:flagellar biosynthetic protein FliR [Thiohalobacter sp. IOR34]|uniref:flagellar biosynthetic protein FliR n=1 Tax=Thiohalobacter sp. IOR34 TaxID=3057176 RepID=UPI0025AF9504|nr:flagellar biosynthetic protein FliR [Thiohalobacter sp. IOR34]WJW74563.1 flagellar biosynthetic protein FliR [Thiohalobacter sp. IOR34]